MGDIGKLRIYPEQWDSAPRVTEIATELQLTDLTRSDFGQPLRTVARNDLATTDDDLATEYQYAWSTAQPPIAGLVSTEAKRELMPDNSSGLFLSYKERFYDGLPLNVASAGNQTSVSEFDGSPQAYSPSALNVVTRAAFDPDCPGKVRVLTDPNNFDTTISWDDTCTFSLEADNPLGHKALTNYYGVRKNGTPLFSTGTRTGLHGSFDLQGHYGQSGESVDANGATTLTTYDQWGRKAAMWAPLDRAEHPKLNLEYRDAVCDEERVLSIEPLQVEHTAIGCDVSPPNQLLLQSPPRITTSTWDDQLRRCRDQNGEIVDCSDAAAVSFVNETATGAYRKTHTFADGQTQSQVVNNDRPDWSLSGIADYDIFGRKIRSYRTRYLPRQASSGIDACPAPGVWCDSAQLPGDPLRSNVAAIQTAYDAQNRVIRTYGPTVPQCNVDPSALDPSTGEPACDTRIPQGPDWDVTKVAYPRPGDVVTTDAKGVPTLVHRDSRGLVTLFQEYVKSTSGSFDEYSKVESIYDRLGRLNIDKDQDGNLSTKEYDALSRVMADDDPDLGKSTYRYDLRSHITDRILATGEKTTYAYDPLERVVQTDYLRPKPGPSGSPTQTRPVVLRPPYECAVAPGPQDPVQLIPSQIGPRPPFWELLSTAEGDERSEAHLSLPFDLSIPTRGLLVKPATSIVGTPEWSRFAAGTQLSIGKNGTITVGRVSSRNHGIALLIFATAFVVKKGGLRYAITGNQGARQIWIEWDGVLASDKGKHVTVRAILSENGTPVRYEYERVPQNVTATVGVRNGSDDSQSVSTSSLRITSGSALVLGQNLPSPATRLSCRENSAIIEVPVTNINSQNSQLHLRYRVFADCKEGCGKNLLQIGYRDPDNASYINPLTVAKYSQRPLKQAEEPNLQNADAIDLMLPRALNAKNFILDLRPSIGSHLPFVFDLGALGLTSVVYEPEERVLRTYDSSEPPYFIRTDQGPTNTNRSIEALPVLDFSFDVPGLKIQRSLSGAELTCNRVTSAAVLETNVVAQDVLGASGRGLQLTNDGALNMVCQATHFSFDPRQFSTELWVQPHGYPTKSQVIWSVGGKGPKSFSISVLPITGKISCSAGNGTMNVTSNVSIPTDAWSHIAFAFDGTNMRCFVNGVQKGTSMLVSGALSMVSTAQLGDSSGSVSIDVDEVRIIPVSLSGDEILADALRPLSVGPPRGNLVHIDFAHPLSGTSQADQSKAHNDATWISGQIVPGIQGMSFDTGVSSQQTTGGQVRIQDSPTLRLTNALTAELWIKTRAHKQGPARLTGKWSGPSRPGWKLDLEQHSGQLRWEVVTEFVPKLGTTSTIRHEVFVSYETVNDDKWHHVTGTYDGNRLRLFIDGFPAHRWCSPLESTVASNPCSEPPAPSECAVDITRPENPDVPQEIGSTGSVRRPIGDAVCLEGIIDNHEPILVANDGAGAEFDGFVDEIRLSNYAKKEFEVAASAQLASAFTQTLGEETILRNQLPVSNYLEYQVAREGRAYDLEGRILSLKKHVRGQLSAEEFLARTVPDSFGRRAALEFPDGEVAVSGFDLAGTENSLIGYGPLFSQSPSQSQVYVRGASSTVTGKPAQMLFGNSVNTAWSYEDNSTPAGAFGRDILHSSTVMGTGGILSDRVYGWDVVGNLQTLNDNALDSQGAARFAATYGYDDLRRVSSAAITISGRSLSPTADSYAYDPLGDLTSKEGAIQEYGRANVSAPCALTFTEIPHAITQRLAGQNPEAYCYDDAGRLTNSEGRPFAYFARGKLSQIKDASGNLLGDYSYDGNGDRVKKVESRSTQVIPFDFYREIQTSPASGTPMTYEAIYSADAQLIARRQIVPSAPNPQNVWWYSLDHLGGTNFVTNLGGSEVAFSRAYYRPFGDFAVEPTLPPSLPPAQPAPHVDTSGSRLFTSKELDATGLYDFSARPYDPLFGRFTQADEALAGFSAQARNRYSYASNNPLRYIDQNGRWPTDIHNRIANEALPGLSDSQLARIREHSLWVDRAEGQTVPHNHEHAMRGPAENAADARRAIDLLIRTGIRNAQLFQSSKDAGVPLHAVDIDPQALDRFTETFHYITDRLSPSHTDPTTGEPLVWNGIDPQTLSDLGAHKAGESAITPAQMNEAVQQVREAFREAFGDQALLEATRTASFPEASASIDILEKPNTVPSGDVWEPNWNQAVGAGGDARLAPKRVARPRRVEAGRSFDWDVPDYRSAGTLPR